MKKNLIRVFAIVFFLVFFISLGSSPGLKNPIPQERSFQSLIEIFSRDRMSTAGASGWVKTYGGFFRGMSGTEDDFAHAIVPSADGGCVVAVTVAFYPPDQFSPSFSEAKIIKIKASGVVDWLVPFLSEHLKDGQESPLALIRTRDGGYLAAGNGDTGIQVMKLGSNGRVKWIKAYGGSFRYYYCLSIAETADGGSVITCPIYMSDSGTTDIWVFKLDSSGKIIWQRAIGSADNDYPYSIRTTPDGGFMVVGLSEHEYYFWVNQRAFALKLTSTGARQWHKSFTADPTLDETGTVFTSVYCEPNGNYILAGYIYWGYGHTYPFFNLVCKLDHSGRIIWHNAFYGGHADTAGSITKTGDGGYLVTGSRAWKINSSGRVLWQRTFGGENNVRSFYWVSGAFQRNDGRLVMAANGGPAEPFAVMNLDSTGKAGSSCPFIGSGSTFFRDFPLIRVSDLYTSQKTDAQAQTLPCDSNVRSCKVKTLCTDSSSSSSSSEE